VMEAKRRERAAARERIRLAGPAAGHDRVRSALDAWLALRRPCIVVGYVALPAEVDLGSIIGRHGHRWGLVRLLDPAGLDAAAWDAPRGRSRYGTAEPAPGAAPLDLGPGDVVLVPALAFDRSGFRLGHGGGHYDRYLASLPTGVVTVGITTDDSIVPQLPVEPHDRRVDFLCTESGIRTTPTDEPGPSALLDRIEHQDGGPARP